MTWMITVVRNQSLDHLRRHRLEPWREGIEAAADRQSDAPGPLDWASASEEAARLRHCLDQLEAVQRNCLLLAYCEGYTHEELAGRLRTPLGTVKSWIRRGLQRLKGCLDP